jgi:glutaminyl-tRNA synthetase
VNAADAVQAEIRLYDRLFTDATPDAGGKDFMTLLNPNSLEVIQAYVEPGMAQVEPDTRLQFERHGYFVTDRKDSQVGKPVFNRITTLRFFWQVSKVKCQRVKNKKPQRLLWLFSKKPGLS